MDPWSEEIRRQQVERHWDEIVDLYLEESSRDESMRSICNTILSVSSNPDQSYIEAISALPIVRVMLEDITRVGIEEIRLRIEERGGMPVMKGGDWNG